MRDCFTFTERATILLAVHCDSVQFCIFILFILFRAADGGIARVGFCIKSFKTFVFLRDLGGARPPNFWINFR